MAFFHQLKLLLWKNFTLQKRQKIWAFLQICWPVVLFAILALVRTRPLKHFMPECHFDGRPMPSAGPLPFMQGFVCTIDNKCHHTMTADERPGVVQTFNTSLLWRVFEESERVLSNESEVGALSLLIEDLVTLQQLADLANQGELDCMLQLGSNVVDVAELQELVTRDGLPLTPDEVRELATDAQLDLDVLLSISDISEVSKEALCRGSGDEDGSGSDLLVFPDRTKDHDLIEALCNMTNDQYITLLTDLQQSVDVFELTAQISACAESSTLSKTLNYNSDTFNEHADAFNALQGMESLKHLIREINDTLVASFKESNITSTDNITEIISLMSQFVCGRSEPLVETNTTAQVLDSFTQDALDSNNEDVTDEDGYQNKYEGSTQFCSELFTELESRTNTKVIWHMIEPIVRGYIPYSPNTPAVNRLIKQANTTFQFLDDIKQVASEWLQLDLQASTISDSAKFLARTNLLNGTLDPELLDLLQNETEIENILDVVNFFMNATKNYLECAILDKFQPHETEAEVEKFAAQYQLDDSNSSLWAGLIFDVDGASNRDTLPTFVKYKIRMDISMVDSTQNNKVMDRSWSPGPRRQPPYDMKYLVYGFAYIQDMIEHAIIHEHTGMEEGIGVVGQQFPYPCYIDDRFVGAISRTMPMFMVIAWVFNMAFLVKSIVYEKEKRLKEVMHMMGLDRGVHWAGWLITAFTIMFCSALLLLFVLKVGNVLEHSDGFLVLLYLMCFILSTITQAFLVSVFFTNANLGALCAAFIFYLSYTPYGLVTRYEEYMSSADKAGVSILAPVAFGIGCSYISRYEESAEGMQWSNIAHSPMVNDSFSILSCMIMMIFDAFLYWILTWYIEAVFPGRYGMPKPFYFPFLKSYWCGEANYQSVPVSQLQMQDSESRVEHEREPTTIPVGVSVCNLTKVYPRQKKPAVNHLTLNFYQGQITSLLGHNGAGKTTTMSVLTGLFPPTEGTAKIYGLDIRTHIDDIRKILGMCPQHNVLFDRLTVEEHIWFYGQLKGMSGETLQRQMNQIVEDVGLPDKRHKQSSTLSGGMKRKLSVAMAFVAGSKVVILDEPTAGVDPYARRSIWELLIKYKKDCTIVLSTHFMDEADLLGDRIAILAQGQLKCSGSSMFLKSLYSSGYHLTLVNQDTSSAVTTPSSHASSNHGATASSNGSADMKMFASDDDFSLTSSSLSQNSFSENELSHSRYITNFIQRFMPEAKLEEDIGTEYTYNIPQELIESAEFDKLLEELDANLKQLQISSYGISDTSLEEVFLKVASNTENDEESERQTMEEITDGGRFARPVTRLSFRRKVNTFLGANRRNDDGVLVQDDELAKLDDQGQYINNEALHRAARMSNGQGSYTVTGAKHLAQQFYAMWVKRFHNFRRHKTGFIAEILLPAIFVCFGMIFAVIHPYSSVEPPLELHPWHLVPSSRAYDNRNLNVFYSNDASDEQWSTDLEEQLLSNIGMGTRCMDTDTYSIRDFPCEAAEKKKMTWTEKPVTNITKDCSCDTGVQRCPKDATPDTSTKILTTSDKLHQMTGRNITDWLVKTMDKYKFKRYGGLSFGEIDLLDPTVNYTSIDDSVERLFTAANGGERPTFSNVSADNLPPIVQNIQEILNVAVTRRNTKVWFNNKGYISLVSYMNAMNNLILRANLPSDKNGANYGIAAVNHPLNRTFEQLEDYILMQGLLDVMVAVSVIFAMSFVPATFILFLIAERTSKSKHLQLVSGVKPVVYWLANYTWDMVNYSITGFLCVLIFLAFQQEAFVSEENLPCLILLLLLYGFAITPLMYPASFFFEVPSVAFVFLACVNFIVGLVSTMSTYILELLAQEDEELKEVNDVLTKVFLLLPHYCFGRGLIDMTRNQIMSSVFERIGLKYTKSVFAWDLVGRNMFFLFLEGIILFVITLLIQYRSTLKKFLFCRQRSWAASTQVIEEDIDVGKERERVLSKQTDNDVLILTELTKVYGGQGNVPAVNRLSVGVHRGECFGLLGVNGAGKTTTFKMLAGDTSVTAGDATLNGHSILSAISAVHQYLGYCPQFDALCPLMTCREHLYFYGRLRGIPNHEIPIVVEWALCKLGLQQHADKCSDHLSGGNKRKLSTAIALIGNPPVIFLDEPTTGMDPKARRFLWNAINQIVKEGRSVILTSHSMEECEALCSRLAIMVNGTFRCIGSTQHLKNRFGQGYTVTVRAGGDEPNIRSIVDFMEQSFPGAVQRELHHNMVEYQLPNQLPVAHIFKTIKRVVGKLEIEDYNVSQTSLDQVFIHFAKQQKELQSKEQMSRVDRILHAVKSTLRRSSTNNIGQSYQQNTVQLKMPKDGSGELDYNSVC